MKGLHGYLFFYFLHVLHFFLFLLFFYFFLIPLQKRMCLFFEAVVSQNARIWFSGTGRRNYSLRDKVTEVSTEWLSQIHHYHSNDLHIFAQNNHWNFTFNISPDHISKLSSLSNIWIFGIRIFCTPALKHVHRQSGKKGIISTKNCVFLGIQQIKPFWTTKEV